MVCVILLFIYTFYLFIFLNRDVYKHYAKSIGIWLVVLTIILNTAYQGLVFGSNKWLAEWSNDRAADHDMDRRNNYLGGYAGFGFGQGKVFLDQFKFHKIKNFNLKFLFYQFFVIVKYLQCPNFFLNKTISICSSTQFFHVVDSNARFYKFSKSDA